MVQSHLVEIVILPTLSASTAGGGSVAVDPPAGAWLSNGTAVVTTTPARDFHAAFGLGKSERTIATVHADVVALTAIQGLNRNPHTAGQRRMSALILQRHFLGGFNHGFHSAAKPQPKERRVALCCIADLQSAERSNHFVRPICRAPRRLKTCDTAD